MGVLSFRLKSKILDLLKCLNKLNWVIILFSLINLSVCIYEDQIGKFDWRQTYVGRIKFAQFDTVSTAKRIIVATEENVLAALHLKTGQVVWRHVFENSPAGNIQLLHVSDKVLTVTGSNPYLVRGWDASTGVLLYEWSLSLNSNQAEFSSWWVQHGMLVHMLPMFGAHIEVTMYNMMTGQNKGSTSRLPASWTNDGCVLTPPYYTCISGGSDSKLITLDVTSQAVQILSKPLADYIQTPLNGGLKPLDGNPVVPGFIIDEQKVVLIQDDQFVPLDVKVTETDSLTIVDCARGPLLLKTWSEDGVGFGLSAFGTTTSSLELGELRSFDPELSIPSAQVTAAMCTKTAKEQHVCRILVTAADDASHLVQQGGRVLWSREESLANVVAAEFVDLPVSDLDAAIESEFDQKEGSIWGAFTRRIATQLSQLEALFSSVATQDGVGGGSSRDLVRDYFNLHKIIVLVTDVGKIFGMDNLSGELLWQRYEPSLNADNVVVYTRRTSRHPPLDSYCTVIGKHIETGNGLLVSFNPITGALVGENVLHLDTRLLQAALLHRADDEKLNAVVLLDAEETVQVLPRSSERLIENFYMYVADPRTAHVQGYAIRYNGQTVIAQKVWSLNLGGHPDSGHRIVSVVSKPANERSQSAGRALPDRSVLYTHNNHNLLLFVTHHVDHTNTDVVIATCVDAVSGAVTTAATHRRARPTPLAVHADNFMAYVYFNDKQRRTEIATLELYEGKQRWLPPGAAFSSLATDRSPHVERQAYIAAAAFTAMSVTRTERALTDKHVLLAMTTGAIVELPWAYLEPRRKVAPTPEQREEGLIPYAPELPLPAEAVINYNVSLQRVSQIYTAPAGIESTCLVLATGLDLFYTRVSPSKTFDLLKEDFDYYLITIVLIALILATYSTKYFASRKTLRNAWK